jgi:Tol biopolymer transport system component
MELNTQYQEGAPFLSYDGLTLYFSRQYVPGPYIGRLYGASRAVPVGPFTSEEELTTFSREGYIVNYPWVSPDNLRLYYYEVFCGGAPFMSIKRSERPSTHDPWVPSTGVTELNALGSVGTPSLTPDELTIVFTGDSLPGGLGGYDIWMGTRLKPNVPFGDFRDLAEINTTAWDFHPRLSSDALTLYFSSRRNGVDQLFKSERASVTELFGPAETLSFFDKPGTRAAYPCLSNDGQAFYFARDSAQAPWDIYVSYSPIPAPGALLLGGIGVGLVTWLRRRRRL